ncbi:Dyp-type peroxidase [Larkinella sp. VNQ87]|uniref:Dyp-type peroxidase n=1 Tax=Larkinella sp. VNQ87 TaxID=3400921 RepID=UPI003C0A9A87
MLNPLDPQNRPLFEGIQGNILKAHGRHHTANLFILGYAGQVPEAKAWLKSLVTGKEAIVHSGYEQLRNNILFKESKGQVDTGLFACVHISAAGYEYLFGTGAKNRFSDNSFQQGMKKAQLNDPGPSEWEIGHQADNHFMLLLAHANPDALTEAIERVGESIRDFGRITTLERGEALFNAEGAGIEHFGYVDGVSQPLFFTDELDAYKAANNIKAAADFKFNPSAEKELVLVKDPFADQTNASAFGSYFVFRKLEQDVKGFKLAESALADLLGLTNEARERAGAMLVGRFEDGTPIEMSDREGMIHGAVWNNFDYTKSENSKCPFHGHTRKTNPRSDVPGGVSQAKTHMMARRGIPFGTRTDDPSDGQIYNKPEKGVGLLFMSYQASIENQFEFIQKSWANNSKFPNFDPQKLDGLDPIIGQGLPRVEGTYATKYGDLSTLKSAAFGQFVHMKGGEYFFAPSMNFLENVDRL